MSRLAPVVVGLVIALSDLAHAQPDAPRVRLTEDLRLDATAEDFPRVGSVFVGPRGHIVVSIPTDLQLRVYDPSGKRVAVFGRKGSGPGEFQHVSFFGWSGDSIWVGDVRQRRTTFIGPDFKLIRTEIWPASERREGEPGTITAYSPLALLSDGSWLGQGIRTTTDASGYRVVLAVRAPNGTMRTILEKDYESDPRNIVIDGLGRPVPFSLQPQFAFAPNGSRVAELTAPIPASQASHFNVMVLRPAGDSVFSRRYQFRGIPVSKHDVDSALTAMNARPGQVTDLDQRFHTAARQRMSSWYIPVETITLGLDETVWVGMRLTDEGREYLILNSRGDPVATVQLPKSSRLRQASATQVWVTEADDDGLTSVIRYRVDGLTCGAVRC